MLEHIASGQRDAVIVYNTDRLTRRPIELEQFTAVCKSAGVRQLVAVTGDIDLGNDDGMFMARVLAAVEAEEAAAPHWPTNLIFHRDASHSSIPVHAG